MFKKFKEYTSDKLSALFSKKFGAIKFLIKLPTHKKLHETGAQTLAI